MVRKMEERNNNYQGLLLSDNKIQQKRATPLENMLGNQMRANMKQERDTHWFHPEELLP